MALSSLTETELDLLPRGAIVVQVFSNYDGEPEYLAWQKDEDGWFAATSSDDVASPASHVVGSRLIWSSGGVILA